MTTCTLFAGLLCCVCFHLQSSTLADRTSHFHFRSAKDGIIGHGGTDSGLNAPYIWNPVMHFASRWAPLKYRRFSKEERTSLYAQLPRSIPDRHPILFVPPMMGTQLEYRLHKKVASSHWWCCREQPEWRLLWVNILDVVPGWFACFVDNIRLLFNPVSGLSHSDEGVEVRTRPDDIKSALGLFGELLKTLEHLGWSASKDLVVGGYDWRLTPGDWLQPGGSFDALRVQIEATVAANQGRPVIAFGVSMGSSYFSSFLTSRVDEAWKATYIRGFVSISGVWGGTPRALQELLEPWLYGVDKVVNREQLQRLVRSVPSISWMMPAEEVFGSQPTYFNTALNTSYSAATVGDLLRDAGAQQAADVWTWSRTSTLLPAPNVTMYCVYSLGIRTLQGFTSDSPDFSTRLINKQYGDGDMTVPKESVAYCEQYQSMQTMPVYTRNYEGFPHAMMVNDPTVLKEVVQMVLELNGGAEVTGRPDVMIKPEVAV